MIRTTKQGGQDRLASIDAYRGLVMFLMLAEVLHLRRVANALPKSKLWEWLAYHQSHVDWIGCSLHDLIQPSFSFLVGVALPFSIASRQGHGQSTWLMAAHAFWRSFLLIALGIFLRSIGDESTDYTFEDTLTQIGLGYPVLFLLGLRPSRDRWITLGVILLGYWAAFALYPAPGADFDYVSRGVPIDWRHLMDGFEAHWNKNSNLAMAFDRWFLNLFPRPSEFEYNGGGYATLSFIPTLGTMIIGLIAGQVLKDSSSAFWKVGWLVAAGIAMLALGYGIGELGLCPVVKRIWTPTWTLFSGGCCLIFLGLMYGIVDGIGWKSWTYPLRVIGANSIAAYLMDWLFVGFISSALDRHLGRELFRVIGEPFEPLLHGAAVFLVIWLMLGWLYHHRVFIKI